MKVLLTNDDGIHAPGLWALYKRFKKHHSVTVIAPDRERTGVGHGITLNEPIRMSEIEVNGGFKGYAASGTPADCVKLGVLELLDTKPDMIISGINPGPNVGVNINYSGTVAAAREAALYGVPSMAVSIERSSEPQYQNASSFIEELANLVFHKGLPFGTFLNVNIPDTYDNKTSGIQISRQGLALFYEYFDKRTDPRDQTYYWQGVDKQNFSENLDVDGTALNKKYITITPVKCDMTDYQLMEEIKGWGIKSK